MPELSRVTARLRVPAAVHWMPALNGAAVVARRFCRKRRAPGQQRRALRHWPR